jgi:hypothetical protein
MMHPPADRRRNTHECVDLETWTGFMLNSTIWPAGEIAVPILAMHSSIDTRTDFGAIK